MSILTLRTKLLCCYHVNYTNLIFQAGPCSQKMPKSTFHYILSKSTSVESRNGITLGTLVSSCSANIATSLSCLGLVHPLRTQYTVGLACLVIVRACATQWAVCCSCIVNETNLKQHSVSNDALIHQIDRMFSLLLLITAN